MIHVCPFWFKHFWWVFQKAWVRLTRVGIPGSTLPFSYISETRRQHFTCHLRFIWQERLKFLRLMGGQKFVDAATSMVPQLQFGSQWRRCQNPPGDVFGSVRIPTRILCQSFAKFRKRWHFWEDLFTLKNDIQKNISRKTYRENPEKKCQGRWAWWWKGLWAHSWRMGRSQRRWRGGWQRWVTLR